MCGEHSYYLGGMTIVDSMLGHGRKRWPAIEPAMRSAQQSASTCRRPQVNR